MSIQFGQCTYRFEGSAEKQQLRALCKQVGKDFASLNKADVAATMRTLRELTPLLHSRGVRCERAWTNNCVGKHAENGKVESCQIDTIPPGKGKRCCGRTGERTPLVPLQACAGWAESVSCHPHPRILLPQNRCRPYPLAAPFPRQPEPRYNTLDFASKVVCQRAFRCSLESFGLLHSQQIATPRMLAWQAASGVFCGEAG